MRPTIGKGLKGSAFQFIDEPLSEFGDFRTDQIRTVGLRGISGEIFLMIGFSHKKVCRFSDLGDDRLMKDLFFGQRGDGVIGDRLLFGRMIENGRAVSD